MKNVLKPDKKIVATFYYNEPEYMDELSISDLFKYTEKCIKKGLTTKIRFKGYVFLFKKEDKEYVNKHLDFYKELILNYEDDKDLKEFFIIEDYYG